jgi:ABC-type dipeptide/oligopeptide/nickel transport system permease subunit
VSPRPWLAIAVAIVLAVVIVRWLQGWARRTARGRRLFSLPTTAPAVGTLVVVVTLALGAPLATGFGPADQPDIVGGKNLPPSWAHPLGTDLYSRDVWSRLVFGARVSLAIGSLAAVLAVSAGAVVGAVSGYWRRTIDAWLMRAVDVGLAFPRVFLFLMIVALFGQPSVLMLVVLIGGTSWFTTSRLVRAEMLSVRERTFVDAAHALGAGSGRLIARHLVPNVAAPIIVSAALGIGNVMLLEAGLSFLGVGVAPPTPTWGNMIADGSDQIAVAPWSALAPGLAISLVVMALNAVGDALRDALDPRVEAS